MPAPTGPRPEDIVTWWREAGPSRWFRKDEAFDREFRDRFLEAHEAAARGDLDSWGANAQGALALCILLDQFPRNAFRGTPRMFATDAKARSVAHAAVAARLDEQVDDELKQFFYLPFMHSEDPGEQDLCVELTSRIGTDSLRFAQMHRDIIRRFGRFPHRNDVLGRESTREEREFLASGGFSG